MRKHSYDEIERLAVEAEKDGGFSLVTGRRPATIEHSIVVGDVELDGADAFELLLHLGRRATQRERGDERVLAEQAREDARREIAAAVAKTLERFA